MVVDAILDERGRPVCCEMWPGNTADVKTLLPVVERLRTRFSIQLFCIVADRGMISAEIILELEKHSCNIPYILGARMRSVKEVNEVKVVKNGMVIGRKKIDENGRRLAVRTSSLGTCGKVFRAVGVAMPPTIPEL